MVTTRPPKTIVKPTALGPVANTDTKLLIYGLFQKGRVLAQDGIAPNCTIRLCLLFIHPRGKWDYSARRKQLGRLCLLFIHPGAPNLISFRSAGTIPA